MSETYPTVRVVVYSEGEMLVAQCLEYDIGAQGESFEDVTERFHIAFEAEYEASIEIRGEPFAGVPPAPRQFFEMWEECSSTVKRYPAREAVPSIELASCA
ncbi:MAG: hypothetical protein RIM84_21005 [Alphaproteobacteria bacterium]